MLAIEKHKKIMFDLLKMFREYVETERGRERERILKVQFTFENLLRMFFFLEDRFSYFVVQSPPPPPYNLFKGIGGIRGRSEENWLYLICICKCITSYHFCLLISTNFFLILLPEKMTDKERGANVFFLDFCYISWLWWRHGASPLFGISPPHKSFYAAIIGFHISF